MVLVEISRDAEVQDHEERRKGPSSCSWVSVEWQRALGYPRFFSLAFPSLKMASCVCSTHSWRVEAPG